jgi:nanoRNase/pAp phosphatase (c-di-AMP/oligoRNAs hydrolase)
MDKRKEKATARKVAKLLEILSIKKNILIVAHDNPDPDTLASAFALRGLINRKIKAEVTIGYGGIIGRAENRAMIRHLNIPLKHLDEFDPSKYDAAILVDSQQRTGQSSLPEMVEPDVIIDHHPVRPESKTIEFHDIQSRIGATSTILTQYYMALGLEPDAREATALLYGIKSDTRDLGRETSKHDLEAYLYLYQLANLRLLAKIEYAELPANYFKVYDRAIDGATTFNGAVVSFIGDIDNPDMVAEMADTLIRLEGASCALVGGYHDQKIFVSLRTKNSDIDAGKLVQRVIGKLGPSGGHGSMSAGRITLETASEKEKAALERNIVTRLKRAMKLKGVRGKKLIR